MDPCLSPGSSVQIRYSNASGETSERRIDIKDVWNRGSVTYVRAYCHRRGEDRTFRADRMTVIGDGVGAPQPLIPSSAKTIPPRIAIPSPRSPDPPPRGRAGILILAVFFSLIATAVVRDTDLRKVFVHVDTTVVEPTPTQAKTVSHTNAVERPPTREEIFIRQTGITDNRVLSAYRAADLNFDEQISWDEVERFQNTVYERFRYINNDTALRPDVFFASGGGDCEDYSLFTCGMFEYWGIECWVGHFVETANPRGANGHAVVLVAVNSVPSGFSSIRTADTVDIPVRARGRVVVPIDYTEVGGFTDATPRRWTLLAIYDPVQIYGAVM